MVTSICKYCKIIASENNTIQYKLVVMDLDVKRGDKQEGGKMTSQLLEGKA